MRGGMEETISKNNNGDPNFSGPPLFHQQILQTSQNLPARFAPGRPATAATATTGTTAATAAAIPAAATSARTIAAKSTAAARARLTWPSFVYCKCPSTQFRTIQGCHCFIRITVHGHFYKGETTRLPGIPVLHNLNAIHLAVCGKGRIEVLLGSLERNVPDINILQDVLLLCVNRHRRRTHRLVSKALISAGKLIEAGKVAVKRHRTAVHSYYPVCGVQLRQFEAGRER